MSSAPVVKCFKEHVLKIGDDLAPREISDIESLCGLDDPKPPIKLWLSRLFQSEHLSLLVGNGLSKALHYIASQGKPGAGMDPFEISVFNEQVNKAIDGSVHLSGRGAGNIEDKIRVINELIKGLDIYLNTKPSGSDGLESDLYTLKASLEQGILSFANAILKSESEIINSPEVEQASQYVVNFLVGFAGRKATRDRLNIFTTNYDRIIEFGCELAGIRLIDRFIGSINPIFRSSRLDVDMHYNPPGIRGEPRYLEGVARFTKLHGSLDWVYHNKVVRRLALPYGATSIRDYLPKINNPAQPSNLMIYPNSSKDRETAEYPYVELFRDFAAAIARPNSTLIIYGYSFGDEHINRVIEDMLTVPSTHLVIISFNDEGNRIYQFYHRVGIRHSSQVTLLIGNHFGDLVTLVDNYLPNVVSLSMSDILGQQGYDVPLKTAPVSPKTVETEL